MVKEKSPYSAKYVRKWSPTLSPPEAGSYSKTVRDLTLSYLTEINNCQKELSKYRVMHKKDPTARSCIELKCLRASLLFGTYHHKSPAIEEWVKSNLENIRGSFHRVIGRLAGACAEGFRVAEIVFDNRMSGYAGQWRVKGFNILDSAKVVFEGKDGEIEYVKYDDGNGVAVRIPYWKCIHVVNGYGTLSDSKDSVYGDPESRVAYPYFKAKQAILTEMMVAAKANAGGMWLGKADSNVTVEMVRPDGSPVTNPDGTPRTESAVTALLRSMQNLENNSILVTDKNNDIQPLMTQTNDAFWNMGIELLDKNIRRAYGVPDLIFSEGSSSIQFGSLGKQHNSVLDSQISSIVVQIQDQVLEKAIKPLLVFNFGVTDHYGSFEKTVELDPEQSSMKIQNISSAIMTQAVYPTNLKVKNAILELIGLDSMTEEEAALQMQRNLISKVIDNQILMGEVPAGLMPPNPRQAEAQKQAKLTTEQQALAIEAEKAAAEQPPEDEEPPEQPQQ